MAEEDPERYGFSKRGGSYGSLKLSNENPSSIYFRSSVLGRESVRGNVFKSTRSLRSFRPAIEDRLVPSLLRDNVRLFTISSLDSEVGVLYMKEETFYRRDKQPEFALSVNHDIYQQMMTEVNDAFKLPLGIYFCCHGGDGAHTGVAHDDYVSIHVAWILLFICFANFLLLVFMVPWADNDDDFFP